jgi:acyl-CoA thioesterase-1
MKQAAWVAACVLLAAPRGAAGAETSPPACRDPASITLTSHPMPRVAAALRPGGQLDVLALGSASLLGARGGEAGSVPERMAAALRARIPDLVVRLTMRASRTESAADMLAILRRELAAHRYQLVLWQTGTIEALRSVPPPQFGRTLADGVATAIAAGADLVLIDMQFSRLLDRHADLAPYRAAMTAAALRPGVMLFPRYALMRGWAEDGQLDLEALPKPARRRASARLHECLGAVLARMLAAAAQHGV